MEVGVIELKRFHKCQVHKDTDKAKSGSVVGASVDATFTALQKGIKGLKTVSHKRKDGEEEVKDSFVWRSKVAQEASSRKKNKTQARGDSDSDSGDWLAGLIPQSKRGAKASKDRPKPTQCDDASDSDSPVPHVVKRKKFMDKRPILHPMRSMMR